MKTFTYIAHKLFIQDVKYNTDINVTNYELAQGFNKTVKAKKISILFHQLLKTKISL